MSSNLFKYFENYPQVGVTAGYFTKLSAVHKFGHNGDVGTDWETLWGEGGLYAYLAAASVLKISSSDGNDTSAGSGARTVSISGLDANYDEITETVTLTGQTQATTSNAFLRVHRMIVLTAGAGGKNAGIVYAGTGSPTSGKPATVYGLIEVGLNQTLMSLYTVPNGYRAYILQSHFSSGVTKQVSAGIFARPLGGVFQIKEYSALTDGESVLDHKTAESYAAKTDIEARAKVGVAGGDIACQMEILLEQVS